MDQVKIYFNQFHNKQIFLQYFSSKRHKRANFSSYWQLSKICPAYRNKTFKGEAEKIYIEVNKARAENDPLTLGNYCNPLLAQILREKANQRKNLKIEWKCSGIKKDILSIRHLPVSSNSHHFQILVKFSSNQVDFFCSNFIQFFLFIFIFSQGSENLQKW